MLRVVVIGAGQAGLSAAYYLSARGLVPWEDFVVLDANDGPGGAWRHRWDSLTFGGAHGIHPLPAAPLDDPDPAEPANRIVPRYYGAYEHRFALPVLRPVRVTAVTHDVDGFAVVTDRGRVAAASVISATGTWDSPYIPHYPGIDRFLGRRLHTRDFRSAQEFRGERVLVVGGGTSALQFIQQLAAHGADPVWTTRRTPQWTARRFDAQWGLDVERSVSARTRQGLPPLSVSAATGIPLHDLYAPDIASGLLVSRGPLVHFTAHGAVLDGPGPDGTGYPSQGPADRLAGQPATLPGRPGARRIRVAEETRDGDAPGTGTGGDALWETPIDTVLWATGFRPHVPHLRGLGVRERTGGILMGDDGVTVPRMPGLFLAGYGASASTLGATRAGRRAAMAALRFARQPAGDAAA
ncbi:FAD-dependent oxidoreductase [Microbacterium sp. SYP-A9085]|nr:FAD-dependent oxidoreductase [Microbacterium sp. SYP-A9085]